MGSYEAGWERAYMRGYDAGWESALKWLADQVPSLAERHDDEPSVLEDAAAAQERVSRSLRDVLEGHHGA